ncbi:MAG: hypothetical protein KKA19_03175 [Candidatus Margulisbacteria bacterium]|nr:hypothetical protein [Candidatus Margulisiibacteriota bacterium]
MPVNTPNKVKEVSIFDTILDLCFSGNEAIWDRRAEERKLLDKIKRGEVSMEQEGAKSPGVTQAFQGILLAAFAVFPGIASSQLKLNGKINNTLSFSLETGKMLKLNIGEWSESLAEFSIYYKKKILGWDNPPAGFSKEDWVSLRDVFKYSKIRLEGENTFLESLLGSSKKIISVIANPKIAMDSLLVVLASLPAIQLNMFFIEIAKDVPDYTTAVAAEGTLVDVKNYFSQSTVDTENLFRKIRILLMMYSRHEIVMDYVIVEKARELLLKYLNNDAVRKDTLTQIEKTIYGQYRPRLDIAKALVKLLS